MAYYEKEYKKRLLVGQGNSALIMLIAIHLIVFVLLFFVETLMRLGYDASHRAEAELAFQNKVLSWVTLPASLDKLATRPWTLLTHFFVHVRFWDIFANMLWLWSFGRILQDLTGNRKIFPVFLYGALAGAIAF